MLTRSHCRWLLAALLLSGFVGHVLYLTVSPPIGLAGDEAHYWDWSRRLDWSYYSKGPLIALLIRGGRTLFGDTLLGVRFFALVLAAGTSLCTYWLTNRVFKSERLALGAVALTHAVPLFVAGSLLMTIDSPYYFCWATATCLGYLAAVEKRAWAWPAAGAFVGLGFLAKYAALLWLVNALVYALVADRRLLRATGLWLACAVALAFTTPVLVWNHAHDWVSFGHVARSTSEDQNGFSPLRIMGDLGELLGGQIGLLNPVVFGFLVGGVALAWRRRAEKKFVYLLCIGLPFFIYVSLVTVRKNAEPNWPAATYFSLVPLAAWFVAWSWPKSRGWLIGAVVIGVVAIVYLHEATRLYRVVPLSPRKWDAGARLVGWQDVGRRVSAELRALRPGAFVLSDKYQTASLLAFYVDGRPKTYCLGSYIQDPGDRDRLTQFDVWPDRDLSQPALLGRDAVYAGQDVADLNAAFDRVGRLPDEPIVRGGKTVRVQKLWACHGFRGMTRPTDGLTKR